MRRYEITDQQWTKISELLPGKAGDVGRSSNDNRLFINRTGEPAVLWIDRSGAPWRDLPERFGTSNSAYRRFRRWAKAGIWQQIFESLQEPDFDWLMIDSTIVRAHQHASGQKKRRQRPTARQRVLSRTAGAVNRLGAGSDRRSGTKIHALVDALGNPLRIILTVSQGTAITQAEALLLDYEPNAILSDRGYDADGLITLLVDAEVEVVIPAKKSRLTSRSIDVNLYKDRHKPGRRRGGALF